MTMRNPDSYHAPYPHAPYPRSREDVPPSTLFWLVEALVLGPDRDGARPMDEPRDRMHRLRAGEQRRKDLRDAVHGPIR
jgi:hypothetical protein